MTTKKLAQAGTLRVPGEVFIEGILHPPGIANVAVNCYCSSACLINHPQFSKVARELHRVHTQAVAALVATKVSNWLQIPHIVLLV